MLSIAYSAWSGSVEYIAYIEFPSEKMRSRFLALIAYVLLDINNNTASVAIAHRMFFSYKNCSYHCLSVHLDSFLHLRYVILELIVDAVIALIKFVMGFSRKTHGGPWKHHGLYFHYYMKLCAKYTKNVEEYGKEVKKKLVTTQEIYQQATVQSRKHHQKTSLEENSSILP